MGFSNWVGDHSESILLIVGISASTVAGALFARAGAKTEHDIQDARDDTKEDDIEPKEKAKIAAKNFWVPCVVEGLSIFAILGSNRIKDKKAASAIASAVTSANLATRALDEYRGEVKRQLGETTDRKVRDGAAQKRVDDIVENNGGQLPSCVNPKSEGDVYCIDSLTGQSFWCTPEKLRRAENAFAKDLREEVEKSWSDWIGMLPIRQVNEALSGDVGWDDTDDFALIFTSILENERPVLYVNYDTVPHSWNRRMGDGY